MYPIGCMSIWRAMARTALQQTFPTAYSSRYHSAPMEPLSERIARRALINSDADRRDQLTAFAFEMRATGDRLRFTGPEVLHK